MGDGPEAQRGWKTGITFRDVALEVSSRWPYSPGTSHGDKTAGVVPGMPSFLPFTIYVPVVCDEATYAREPDLLAEAQAQAEATSAFALARELWTGQTANAGAVTTQNPSLQAPFPGATDQFVAANIVAGPTDPVVMAGVLIQTIQDATQAGGVTLHVPVIEAPYLVSEKLMEQVGDLYRGPGGSVVIAGPGYPTAVAGGTPGPKTAAHTTGATTAANQAWMYATGPVEYGLTDVRLVPEDRAMRYQDRRTNQWHVWAERQAIFRFNPSAVFAGLVTVPQTGI